MSDPLPDIDPRLKRALEHLRQVPQRGPDAAARARAAFLARGQALHAESRSNTLSSRYRWFSFRFVPHPLANALAVVILLVLAGGGATVFAAQDSLPDSPLYAVKVMTEDAQMALALPQTRLDLVLDLSDRRVGEIVDLNSRQVVPPPFVANRLQQEIEQALELTSQLPLGARGAALAHIQSHVEKQRRKLAEVEARVAGPAKPVIAEVQESLEERLGDIDVGVQDPENWMPTPRARVTPPAYTRHPTPTLEHVAPALGGTPTSTGLKPQQVDGATATPVAVVPSQEQEPTVQTPGQGQSPSEPPGQEKHTVEPPGKGNRTPPASSTSQRSDDKGDRDKDNPGNGYGR